MSKIHQDPWCSKPQIYNASPRRATEMRRLSPRSALLGPLGVWKGGCGYLLEPVGFGGAAAALLQCAAWQWSNVAKKGRQLFVLTAALKGPKHFESFGKCLVLRCFGRTHVPLLVSVGEHSMKTFFVKYRLESHTDVAGGIVLSGQRIE